MYVSSLPESAEFDYVIVGAGSSGRVIGGSSSIDGSLFVRGDPKKYDTWRDAGCDSDRVVQSQRERRALHGSREAC